jgi:hypothetical protein
VHGTTIASTSENKVCLEDGKTTLKCTKIVWATGFSTGTFPFLPFQPGGVIDRYLGTFHPQEPSVAFIGYVRGIIGSLPFVMQMQAKWFAQVVSENDTLPRAGEEMDREMRHQRQLFDFRPPNLNRVAPSQATFLTADYIASHKLGIDPDLVRIFLASPLAWYTVMFSCISPAHYHAERFFSQIGKCAPWRSKSASVYILANLTLLLMRPFLVLLRAVKEHVFGIEDPLLFSGFEHPF